MTPNEVSAAILAALEAAISAGAVNLDAGQIPTEITVERPRQRSHGDWSTNIAMRLAKRAGVAPLVLAEELATRLRDMPGIAGAEVAGPGFLNITLEAASAGELARDIVNAGSAYGNNTAEAGKHINLEFVSANPTGPIHIGGVRWAAIGDSLARILTASGAKVTREYYFNDHGSQIDNFSASLLAAARGLPTPENGYGGAYISEIAEAVTAAEVEAGRIPPAALPDAEAAEVFRSRGVEQMFGEIQQSLADFGVNFDVFFHEDSLHDSGAVERAIGRLADLGHIYNDDGATWLRTTTFGDDKDRVVIKSNGEAAYIAGDIAYYLDKRQRGADEVIIMLGADHHGYIGRMMAIAAAFGDEPGRNLQILIGQLVNLIRDKQPVRMSKRAGTVITLEDLVDAVGVDAGRYSLARYAVDSPIDLDLNLLASARNENPVFYVQYAHSRTCAVDRNATERGVNRADGFDPALLDGAADGELLGRLAEFPTVVAESARLREPHRIARYLEALAGDYHTWYQAKDAEGNSRRVLPYPDESVTDVHRTRLWLNDAVRQVLANGLYLLGVSAPEQM
ncbi:MAG: arginine--tRNA ligase [Promicromonosporaceae bacterium]|nr:arginine--tRNA ligase [Promicromonosporaceae bacterium]